MADISMCKGLKCSISHQCYRFRAKTSPRQSYIAPDKQGPGCMYFYSTSAAALYLVTTK